ncbi:MFS transporter [Rhodococcus aerolatus]
MPAAEVRARLPRGAWFAVASTALLLVFVSAGTPIPLYNTYRGGDGLTNADLSVATAAYLSAAAVSLLVLGRLSDHLGRRPVGVVALLVSALGLVVLLGVDGLEPLLGGRLLQGLAIGMASSALGAYVVDCAPERRAWLPAVVTTAAPLLGIPLGALLSGALVDDAPDPRQLTYSVVAVLLVVVAGLVALGPETVPRRGTRRGSVRPALASLRPRVLVPAGAGRPLLAMAGLILSVWSLGGFFQAFGPAIAQQQLGSDASLTAGAVFASFSLLAVLGGPLTARVRPDLTMRVAVLAYAVCLGGILLTLRAGAVVPFLLVSLAAGVATGAAQTGGMRTLLARTSAADRAGLLSTVFLLNYSSAAVPSLVAGRLTTTFDLVQIASGYVALAAVGIVAVLVLARPPRHPA